MKSLRYLYRIGCGPSSSHTIGPYRIAKYFKKYWPEATSFEVTLYESFAWTGKGHLTDVAIENVLKPTPTKIIFDYKTQVEHPNTCKFKAFFKDGHTEEMFATSPGGGSILINGERQDTEDEVYKEKNFAEIKKYCEKNKCGLEDYVHHYEGDEIFEYLKEAYGVMMDSVKRGLETEGFLPGKLHVERKAHKLLKPIHEEESAVSKSYRTLLSYAFAVGEENASGGLIVTAPTCGAAATLPAVLSYYQQKYHATEDKILKALAVAGVVGNVIKQNASISGAEAGCQAEIGSACSMAAAAYCYLKGGNLDQIECAAEIAMEHSLGSTCDPVEGYVQIPCIERNAIAADRAVTAARLAEYIAGSQHVSFDKIVDTMYQTGKDLKKAYRETAKGGLAKEMKKK